MRFMTKNSTLMLHAPSSSVSGESELNFTLMKPGDDVQPLWTKKLIVNQLICPDADSTTQKMKYNAYTSGHKISLAFLYFVASSFINHHMCGEKVPNDYVVFATFSEWNSQNVWSCSSCLQFNTKYYEDIFHVSERKGCPILFKVCFRLRWKMHLLDFKI